jgi:hypothetical protein
MSQRTSNPSRSPAGSPTALRAILLGLALAAAAVPASATVFISVEAASNNGGNGDQADNIGNQSPPGGAIHGVAAATRDDAIAFVANGSALTCDFFTLSPGCAFTLPQSRASGEIRGDLGRLRGGVYASTDHSAGVGLGVADLSLELRDVLTTSTLGDLTFNLHFDVVNHPDGIESTLLENFFQLRFSLQPLVAGVAPTEYEFTLPEFQGGTTVVDRSFLLGALPADTQVLMILGIAAHNECGIDPGVQDGSTCSIWTDAGNTAYIGVQGDYVSASGYAYPGFAPTAPVPEPATAGLLAAGLGALGAAMRRRAPKR